MRKEHKKENLEGILFSKENNILKTKKEGKKQKRKSKKEQGITLIALVITIVIMLILAGVTLNAALGENGLFKRAKQAVEEHKKAEETEQETMKEYESQLDSIDAGKKTDIPDEWGEGAEDKVDAVKGGVDSVIPIPKGFYYAGGTISDGFVISDMPNDDLDNSKQGNQFVWIPCTADEYEQAKDDVMEKGWSHNPEYQKNGDTEGIQKDGGDGLAWHDDYNDTDIAKLNEIYTEPNSLLTNEWKTENQITIAKESIEKYGGFYIARFEAGVPDNAPFHVNGADAYITTRKRKT